MTEATQAERKARKSSSEKEHKKKRRREKSAAASEVQATQPPASPPAQHPHAASESPAVQGRAPAQRAASAAPGGGATDADEGTRVLETACCAQELASDDELVVLRVPADIDPAALDGTSVAWPRAPGQAVPLNDADGFELARDPAASHARTYVLGARGGAVSAAPVAASYSIRWQLTAQDVSEDEVDPAWLRVDDEGQGETGPRWTKRKRASSGSGDAPAGEHDASGASKKKKKKRKSKDRELEDTEVVAAAVTEEAEAAMEGALRRKEKRKKDKRRRAAAEGEGQE